MDNDEKFISKWKPIHEKTMVKYVLQESLIILLILVFLNVVLYWIYQPVSKDAIYWVVVINTFSFLIIIVGRVLCWLKGEKRYRNIINNK
ncbi:hypothetical protein V6C32_02855 [Desulforamulus ruminis]|uniref:2TM domain-containing protein n=1 Tax=Desulforamulus ruminis (strain ATCC 23193 / DSM 2154 / NCIMB 8452 / DL) TaxID=696281 RepID=F6DV14_DESRL|nr:hypothetical protein [Desulforamulus ruminis]AEG61411.1 hypothetical protein Desru_3202 [Desulforamulus ruminis DSM 2154]